MEGIAKTNRRDFLKLGLAAGGGLVLGFQWSTSLGATVADGSAWEEVAFNSYLSISPDDFKLLKSKNIDLFIHAAANSDFRSTPAIKRVLKEVNLNGTMRILNLVKQLDVSEFVYTSSAYCAGHINGDIQPDYINTTGVFRNPYEESKLEAELYLSSFAKINGLKYRIFRLTGIGGRLMEPPLGSVSKYDIFYGWGIFFLKAKLKALLSLDNIYSSSVEMPIRIAANLDGNMNVVPVDYAAKIILRFAYQTIKTPTII